MLINILIGGLIFGYAAWTLLRFVKKSKEGKCSTCSIKKSCQSSCSSTSIPSITVSERYTHSPQQ